MKLSSPLGPTTTGSWPIAPHELLLASFLRRFANLLTSWSLLYLGALEG